MARHGSDFNQEKLLRTVETLIFDGKATIDRAARVLGISPRTLNRRLHRAGTTFSHIVDDCRLNSARTLLASSNAKTYQIAAALGYKDPSSFSRAFTRWTGMTPRQYRAQSYSKE